MSKNFKEHEVLGYTYIDGKKVTVLKMGVRRKRYHEEVDPDMLESHLNQELIDLQRWENFYKRVLGLDDFENI